jgi:hypothetical protein
VLAKDLHERRRLGHGPDGDGTRAALAFAPAHDLAALIVSKAAKGLEERLSPALQAMLD